MKEKDNQFQKMEILLETVEIQEGTTTVVNNYYNNYTNEEEGFHLGVYSQLGMIQTHKIMENTIGSMLARMIR